MSDSISRQAVKEWLAKWEGYLDADMIARMQYRVIDIPNAQPEIIRCKDCKYRDADDFCTGRGYPNVLVPDDGFCDKGERRRA